MILWLNQSFRIRLSQRQQTALCFLKEVFQSGTNLSLVSDTRGFLRRLKLIRFHSACITVAATCQKIFDWLTLFYHHQMELQAVDEPPFAREPASPDFSFLDSGTADAEVITESNRETIMAIIGTHGKGFQVSPNSEKSVSNNLAIRGKNPCL